MKYKVFDIAYLDPRPIVLRDIEADICANATVGIDQACTNRGLAVPRSRSCHTK